MPAAQTYKGLPYDYYGAAGSGMFGNKRNQIFAGLGCTLNIITCAFMLNEVAENARDENADKKFFCSELVSRVFSAAGFPIVDGKATNANPCAIYNSSWLTYVGHLVNKSSNLSEEQKQRNRRSGYRKDN